MMTLELWQFYTVLAIITSVLFSQFFKLAVQHSKNDTAATILAQGFAGLAALCAVPFMAIQFSNNWSDYGLFLGAVIFYGIADRIQTTTRKHLEVSAVSLLFQFNTIFLIIYGVILYQEPVLVTKVIGALLILTANCLVLFRNKAIKYDRYILIAIFGIFCLATGISIDIGVSRHFNLGMYTAATLLIPMLFIILSQPKAVKELGKEFYPAVRKYYVLTGIFWAATIILQFKSLQTGELGTVIPLLATSVFLNIIFAYTFLKERSDLVKKLIAAVMVIAGIYFTTL